MMRAQSWPGQLAFFITFLNGKAFNSKAYRQQLHIKTINRPKFLWKWLGQISSPPLRKEWRFLYVASFYCYWLLSPAAQEVGQSRRSLCRWHREWLQIALVGLGVCFPWVRLAGSVDLSPHIAWGVVRVLGSLVYISGDWFLAIACLPQVLPTLCL